MPGKSSLALHTSDIDPQDQMDRRSRYEAEKQLGIRKANGARLLKRLKPIHRSVILAYAEGKPIKQISEELDVKPGFIYNTLNDPLAKELLGRSVEEYQEHLKHVQHKAIDAVREGLDSPSAAVKLAAVDRYVKLATHLGIGEGDGETAEDVIQRIINQVNVQVNVSAEGRGSGGPSKERMLASAIEKGEKE